MAKACYTIIRLFTQFVFMMPHVFLPLLAVMCLLSVIVEYTLPTNILFKRFAGNYFIINHFRRHFLASINMIIKHRLKWNRKMCRSAKKTACDYNKNNSSHIIQSHFPTFFCTCDAYSSRFLH